MSWPNFYLVIYFYFTLRTLSLLYHHWQQFQILTPALCSFPLSLKASPSTPAQSDRSPRSPFQPGPLHSSPLQTPTMSSPLASPCSATASPIGRPPAYHNGHHRPPPAPHKSPFQSKMQSHWLVCVNQAGGRVMKCCWCVVSVLRSCPGLPTKIPREWLRHHSTCEYTRLHIITHMFSPVYPSLFLVGQKSEPFWLGYRYLNR